MRKYLILAVLSCLVLAAAPKTARADDDNSVRVSKDLSMAVGYKMWLNTWETVIPSFVGGPGISGSQGAHLNAIVKGPVIASIPNLSVKYKNFLVSGSYLVTGDYVFPAYQDFGNFSGVGSKTVPNQYTASRTEADVNVGYFVSQNVAVTTGYKNVTQKYTLSIPGTTFSPSYTKYNGATIGIAGSAAIGHGFSLYGNGVGGFMGVTYSGSSQLDHAWYEASEVGIAWRPRTVPLSLSLGYKFQYLTTNSSDPNFKDQPGSDVTRGYILGLNWAFY